MSASGGCTVGAYAVGLWITLGWSSRLGFYWPVSNDFDAPPGHSPRLRVAGYTIDRRLGAGGHSQVWLAHTPAGDPRALKVLTSREAGSDSREAQGLARLRHPHLVHLHEVTNTAEGQVVLVLDYISGGSLAALVAARGALDPGEAVTLLTPLAGVLAHVHAQGVAHGDVSPGNVLFGQDGRPLLCDLGVLRLVGLEAREQGTPGFSDDMGEGAAADVFGLGAVAWFALTGRPPQAAAVRPPLLALNPAIPAELAAVVERCLVADPTKRPDANDLAVAVFDAAPAEPVRLVPTDPDADPLHVVTQRLRRREAGAEWDALMANPSGTGDLGPVAAPRATVPGAGGSSAGSAVAEGSGTSIFGLRVPAGARRVTNGRSSGATSEIGSTSGAASAPRSTSQSQGFDRLRLRRTPPEPVPRRLVGRRSMVVAALVVAGLATGGAAAFYLLPGPDVAPVARHRVGAAPSGPATAATGSKTAASTSPATSPAGHGGSPASSRRLSPAADDPVAAIRELSTRRAAAFNAADSTALNAINVAGSPAAQADLGLLQQLKAGGYHYRGMAFELNDIRVVAATERDAKLTMTARTGTYDVLDASGAVVQKVPAATGRPVTVTLVRAGASWRVANVA